MRKFNFPSKINSERPLNGLAVITAITARPFHNGNGRLAVLHIGQITVSVFDLLYRTLITLTVILETKPPELSEYKELLTPKRLRAFKVDLSIIRSRWSVPLCQFVTVVSLVHSNFDASYT